MVTSLGTDFLSAARSCVVGRVSEVSQRVEVSPSSCLSQSLPVIALMIQ